MLEYNDFMETVEDFDLESGIYSHLNKYMKMYTYNRSRSFIDLWPWFLLLPLLKSHLASCYQISCRGSRGARERKFFQTALVKQKSYSSGLGQMTYMATILR